MQSRVNDNVRWGIIGVGDVCTVKSGPVFGAVAGSALVAVSRRTPGAAEAYAKQHGVPHYFDNAEAVIACEDVDAVYIATPPNSHLPLALMVAAAGKPCLLEKPMARCSSEAAVIAGAFERAGVPLWIAYYRRALPRYRQARDWLPRVGAVREVLCRVWRDKAEDGWRFQRSISGGGLTVDIGSHCMDILDWMLGPLLVEDATSGRRQPVPAGADPADVVEDYSTIRFTGRPYG